MRARGVAGSTSRMGSVSSTADYAIPRMAAASRSRRAAAARPPARARRSSVGLALALPAAWVEFSGRYDAWWVEGLALVVGATGLALLWTGLTGCSPDWIDDES